jgi:hypothetical protein
LPGQSKITVKRNLHSPAKQHMLLVKKIAVIYGGAGSVSSAVARAFSREGTTGEKWRSRRMPAFRRFGGRYKVFNSHAANAGITRKAFDGAFAERTMLKRLPALAEAANAAVLMASPKASAITVVAINITCGESAD